MATHLHISALSFLITACFIIIFGIMWRTIAGRMSDSPVGKAMSAIY